MLKILFAFAAVIGLASASQAGGYGCPPSAHYQTYADCVPQFPQFCPPQYPVYIPQFSGVLFSAGAQLQYQAQIEQQQQLLQPQQLQGQPGVQGQPQQQVAPQGQAQQQGQPSQGPPLPEGFEVLTENCAYCHKEGTRQVAEQGAPLLFSSDRQLAQLTDEMRGKMRSEIAAGSMPPDPNAPLSVEDRRLADAFLKSLKPPRPVQPVQPKAEAPVRRRPVTPPFESEPEPEPEPPVESEDEPAEGEHAHDHSHDEPAADDEAPPDPAPEQRETKAPAKQKLPPTIASFRRVEPVYEPSGLFPVSRSESQPLSKGGAP